MLTDITRTGPYNHVIAAGDLAFGGSAPARCIEMLREAGVSAVYGNTEVYIHSPDIPPGDEHHLKKWERLLEDVWWVRDRLGQERIDWLAALPFELRFNPTDHPADSLLVFHGNPLSVEEMLYPAPAEQLQLIGKIVQPDDDPELGRLLEEVTAHTLAFGHYHYTSDRRWKQFRLVNVAPASMPAKDKDPRARYTSFEWSGSSWEIIRYYIDYDYTQELAALHAGDMPHRLDHANTFPQPP